MSTDSHGAQKGVEAHGGSNTSSANGRSGKGIWHAILRAMGLEPIHTVVLPELPDAPAPLVKHLDSAIGFYDYTAKRSMRRYHRLRALQLVAGASLPVTQIIWSGVQARALAAIFGGIVIVVQGLESMWHDAEHYPQYRIIAERLIRERFLYSVRVGAYAEPPLGKTAERLLAETTEAIKAQDQQQWQALQQSPAAGQGGTQ